MGAPRRPAPSAKLATERLLLRRWHPSDREPFVALSADPRVVERIGMARDPREDFDHPAVPEGHPLRRHVLHRMARSEGP